MFQANFLGFRLIKSLIMVWFVRSVRPLALGLYGDVVRFIISSRLQTSLTVEFMNSLP